MERNIKLLALFNFFTDLDFLAPVAIIYFAKVSGSYALGMSVFSLIFLSSALFEVPTGIFSDRVGRKKTLIAGSLASIFSALSIAIGNTYVWLVLAAVFAGLARSFYSGNNEALLHDSLKESGKEHHYHHYLGKLSSVFQIALAISAVSGSALAALSFSLLVWISVLPKVAMFLISLFIVEPRVHTQQSTNIFAHLHSSLKLFRTNHKLRLLNIVSAIRFALGESAYLFRSAFVSTLWPLWAVGISNMLSNIGAATSYYFSGKIIDKFNTYRVLVFEIIFNRIINLVALIFPSIVSPALMGSTSLTFGVGDVAIKSLQQKEFTDTQRATLGSLGALLHHVAFAGTAFLLGLTADHFGPMRTLIFVHLLLLTPLLFYRKIFRKGTV